MRNASVLGGGRVPSFIAALGMVLQSSASASDWPKLRQLVSLFFFGKPLLPNNRFAALMIGKRGPSYLDATQAQPSYKKYLREWFMASVMTKLITSRTRGSESTLSGCRRVHNRLCSKSSQCIFFQLKYIKASPSKQHEHTGTNESGRLK